MAELFILSEAQMVRLAPLLPADTRGVPRVDDRRVISRIVHVLRSGGPLGGRPDLLRTAQDAVQPIRPLGGKGRLDSHLPGFGRGGRPTIRAFARQFVDESSSLRRRRKRGERNEAIGVSRGGRTTKHHALTDEHGRPQAFYLTGGQAADCRAAEAVLHLVPEGALVIADRGYDTNRVRDTIAERGAAPNIPPKINRRFRPPFSRVLYRARNAIERMFGPLKDFRRIATRYDKLAVNFLAAVHLAATIC